MTPTTHPRTQWRSGGEGRGAPIVLALRSSLKPPMNHFSTEPNHCRAQSHCFSIEILTEIDVDDPTTLQPNNADEPSPTDANEPSHPLTPMNPTNHPPSRLIYPPPRSHPQEGDEGGAREKNKMRRKKRRKEKSQRERERKKKRKYFFNEKKERKEFFFFFFFLCFRFLLQCTTIYLAIQLFSVKNSYIAIQLFNTTNASALTPMYIVVLNFQELLSHG